MERAEGATPISPEEKDVLIKLYHRHVYSPEAGLWIQSQIMDSLYDKELIYEVKDTKIYPTDLTDRGINLARYFFRKKHFE